MTRASVLCGRVVRLLLRCAVWVGLGLLPALWSADAPAAAGGAAEGPGATTAARPQTVAEIIPPRPRPEDNAAPLIMEAIAALEAENVWSGTLAELASEAQVSGYGTSAARNPADPVPSLHIVAEGGRAPSVAEVREEFAAQLQQPAARKALALCAAAATRRTCWFERDYSQGPNLLLPELSKFRNLFRFLSATSYALSEHGDPATAWQCVLQQLQLADLLRDEPILITQLVRVAVIRMALGTLQGVAAIAPPEAALRGQLDAALDRLDDATPWVKAMDGERLLFGEWAFAQTPEKVAELLKADSNAKEAPTVTAEQLAAEHAAYTAAMVRLADLAGRPYYSVKDDLAGLAGPALTQGTVVIQALVPALVPACTRATECQAGVRVTRIGLRLQAHRAAAGSYPARLEELALPDVPAAKQADPFTGKALCYRPEGAGFVLYSVGPDGSDDGGKPRAANEKQGFDVVWRSPR
jgi:hypothetical protein